GDDAVTYRDMVNRVAAVAAGLAARGVRAGDVVALLSYNNVEFLTTLFATNYLGATVMPLNWRLAAPELRYIIDHSQAGVLVCDEALLELGQAATRDMDGLVRVGISTAGHGGWERFADLGVDAAPAARHQVAGDEIHRLMYTSGTTGRPKGV